jgi:CheY-like chemotaxis protein
MTMSANAQYWWLTTRIIQEVLSVLLSSESYQVDLAENGSQALEMIRERLRSPASGLMMPIWMGSRSWKS